MIQDYPALRSPCIKSLSQNHEELYTVLSKVNNFATSNYLVELISQLENKALVTLIFNQNPELAEKFPENCYANDPPCLKFLELTQFDPSIYKFKSFSLGKTLESGTSFCQITSKYLITLLDHNDFAAPIQFDLPNINNIKRDGTQVSFSLVKSAKKALINIDIPSYATVVLSFQTEALTKRFMTNFQDVASKVVISTPRKISVVQNFIALSGCYGEIEDEDEESVEGLSEDDHNIQKPIPEPVTRLKEFSNSGLIEETESLFGSPINTTKDTSITKKVGRAVSIIVAESNPDKNHAHATSSQVQGIGSDIFGTGRFEQVPDSLDQAFETFNNPPVNRGPSDVVIESLPESNKETVTSKKPVKKNEDIWDFESDPDLSLNNPKATSTTNKKYKSKAMKCLTTQMNTIEKKRASKKPTVKDKKPQPKSKVNVQLEKLNKSEVEETMKDIHSSLDSNHHDSFLPLTSPMETAHQRARTRAYSKAITNDEITAPVKPDKVLKGKGRGKKRDAEEDQDAEYLEEQPTKKTKQAVNRSKKNDKEPTVKPAVKSKRGRKKKVEVQQVKGKEGSLELNKTEIVADTVKDVETKSKNLKTIAAPVSKMQGPNISKSTNDIDKNHAVLESTRLMDAKDKENQPVSNQRAKSIAPQHIPQASSVQQRNFSLMSSALSGPLAADTILSEAYTNTLQRQIYESITSFSNQLVKKIHIINDEINKKVMTDLTSKYETLFNDLRDSFQSDVDEMCGFIVDVKGLLNLPEQELINYIKQKKFGTIASRK